MVQCEEWAIFKADSSINPLAFDGLDVQLTTNVVDNSGAALAVSGVTIPAFDKVIKKIRLQGGNKLDAIYLSFGLQSVVNQIVSPAARYFINIDQAGTLTAGDHVVSYQSPLGPVPVIGDSLKEVTLLRNENDKTVLYRGNSRTDNPEERLFTISDYFDIISRIRRDYTYCSS